MEVPILQSCSLALIKSSTHHIEFNYSKSKHHAAVNQYVSSPPFSVGGYDWALIFYPHGSKMEGQKGTYVSVFLKLLTQKMEVDAEFSVKVLHKTGMPIFLTEPKLCTFPSHPGKSSSTWGYPNFVSTDKLEAHLCKDGILVISFNIAVPSAPSGIYDCTGGLCDDIKKLWREGERFDLTFEVEGEKISAHRFILAARSPVFAAELYGSMTEAKSSCIEIKDMKAEVFRALLCFVYTDDYETDKLKFLSVELVHDLFIASDRYALEKLKVQCQQRLFMALSIETVLTTLILAERHSAPWLKEKCLEFASKSENFTQLAVTEDYLQIMQSFPSLFVELRQRVKHLSNSVNNAAKKQKIG
ncbi:BTB/POZ and MATH domain-containing protein 2 [Rhynchospora pubera]|uniref:BTB/POZ and MATH domain-containing protein 2 n=1 Tax=Rhynchospora pubera TaxID=906938 RepID=A0AAV8FCQ5_9POAL|nr:BTB/POZ and MATH domain-containing protein 2 [Rhynchospora pubera]